MWVATEKGITEFEKGQIIGMRKSHVLSVRCLFLFLLESGTAERGQTKIYSLICDGLKMNVFPTVLLFGLPVRAMQRKNSHY